MNNVMTLTGLFMAGLSLTERRILVEDTPSNNPHDYDCVFNAILNQVFDIDTNERDEWIRLIIEDCARPCISTATETACIAL